MDILSIDFGTSFCASAYLSDNGVPCPISFGLNQYNGVCYKFPTVIQYALDQFGKEKKIIGEMALSNLNQSNHADSSIISKIKTELRESKGYIVNGRPKQSVQIVGDLFTRIKELAEQEVNASFTKVIITHPAQYELNKQTLLIESAKLSGFTDIILLEEPKAASYAFIEKHNIAVDSGAIVFDYGGGTIDVAYLYYNSEKNLDFKFAPESKPQCGGEYIDNVVHNYIQGVLGEGKSRLISPLLLANCSQMKINFKASDLETIVYNNTAIQFSREKFDKIIQEKVDEAITLLKDVKKICDDKSFPINYIFLNGGSSRLRTVQEKISAIFHDTKILEYGGDDLAVAIGAILYYKKNVLEDSIGSTRIDTVHVIDNTQRIIEQYQKAQYGHFNGRS